MYGGIGKPCWEASCPKTATHVLTTLVAGNDVFPESENETAYCLEHVIYFAGWLPYCYPDEYTLVGITPPASELFGR
jgi:hypothetical protein